MTGSYLSNYRALNPSATQGKTDLEIALALLAADPTLALRVPEIGRLKEQADDRASIRSGAAYGQNIAASNINATAQKAQQQLGERGWIERAITDPTRRGLLMAEQADQLLNDLQIGNGLTREKIRKLTEIRDKMDAIRASPEFREFQEAEGFKESVSEFLGWSETPTIISEVVTESMSALLSYGAEKIFGGAAAGAGPGAAVGAAGGPAAPATSTGSTGDSPVVVYRYVCAIVGTRRSLIRQINVKCAAGCNRTAACVYCPVGAGYIYAGNCSAPTATGDSGKSRTITRERSSRHRSR